MERELHPLIISYLCREYQVINNKNHMTHHAECNNNNKNITQGTTSFKKYITWEGFLTWAGFLGGLVTDGRLLGFGWF